MSVLTSGRILSLNAKATGWMLCPCARFQQLLSAASDVTRSQRQFEREKQPNPSFFL